MDKGCLRSRGGDALRKLAVSTVFGLGVREGGGTIEVRRRCHHITIPHIRLVSTGQDRVKIEEFRSSPGLKKIILYLMTFSWILVCNRSRDYYFFTPCGATALLGTRPPHCRSFGITLRHTRLGTTPRYEWSAHCWDLYMTTLKTHNRQTSMSHGVIRTRNPSKRAATGIAAVHYINEWNTITIEINYRQNIQKIELLLGVLCQNTKIRVIKGRFLLKRLSISAHALIDVLHDVAFLCWYSRSYSFALVKEID